MHILSTPRTDLRQLTVADAEQAFLLNADPLVLQYTGDEPFANVAAAQQFLANYTHYAQYGMGRWAVIRKADAAFLGWGGLKYNPECGEYDIGYRFFQTYWGQGYATETALACLEWGFTSLQLPAIVGRAQKENIASIRVLEKLGMHYVGGWTEKGDEWVCYQKNNPYIT